LILAVEVSSTGLAKDLSKILEAETLFAIAIESFDEQRDAVEATKLAPVGFGDLSAA
jgi:hypothetical protein